MKLRKSLEKHSQRSQRSGKEQNRSQQPSSSNQQIIKFKKRKVEKMKGKKTQQREFKEVSWKSRACVARMK